MSKRNLLLSTVAVFSSLPLIVGLATWQFPLNAAPQEVQDGVGVEVRLAGQKVLHRAPVAYPLEARDKSIGGTVVVSVTLNSQGEVADAKVASGPEELRKAVLSSVLNWHFALDGSTQPGSTFDVAVQFATPQVADAPAKAAITASAPAAAQARSTAPMPTLLVEKVDYSSLQPSLREAVSQIDLPREGETLTPERIQQVNAALRRVDSHLAVTGSMRDSKMLLRIYLNDGAAPRTASLPPTAQQLRIGGNEQATKLVSKVTPAYPPLAKQARVQGVVRLTATIDREGNVANLEVISGHPLLVPAAVSAVKQWVYKPTLLNGNPTDVITQIDLNFTLSDVPPAETGDAASRMDPNNPPLPPPPPGYKPQQ